MGNKQPIGTLRKCRKCTADYGHFGANASLCRPCLNAHKRAEYQASKSNPRTVERRRVIQKAAYHRNKRVVDETLKRCRCESCREADPRALAFFDQQGKYLPISYMIRRNSIETLKAYLKQCRVLCFNCRAKLPKSRVHALMVAA